MLVPLCLLVPLLVGRPASADYPSPRAAGFHHCALIYHRTRRTATDLLPYVAEMRNGKPAAWLFDSFLFLVNRLPSGRSPMTGRTVSADWRYHLDTWFAPQRDLAALEAAVAATAKVLGPPPGKRRIMLSLPRPNPAVTRFGDVDGDGQPEDLTTTAGRDAVLNWYVHEACRRFATADYKYLELWGFYWMRESIPPDDRRLVRRAAAVVHGAGKRLLWIPWYRAPGWDRWRECAIDVALMQPNYAFFSNHRGRIRRNRLTVAAWLARTHGLGVECELPMFCTDPQTRYYFLRYLADGAPRRDGYQTGATAYYLGVDNLDRLRLSGQRWQRELYSALAAYVHGQPVPAPDPSPFWRMSGPDTPSPGEGTLTAEADLSAPTQVSAVDVFLDEPEAARSWRGTVRVSTKPTRSSTWRPAGWAIRYGHAEVDLRWQTATVPVNRRVVAVQVVLRTSPESPPPTVAGIGLDSCPITETMRHLAMGLPYRLSPGRPGKYPDDGNELTDGVVAAGGFASGRTVGWHGGQTAVLFDLGRPVALDNAEVYLQGGGDAAVNWPREAVLVLSRDRPPPLASSGVGAPPVGFTWVPASLVIDRKRAPGRVNGHLVFPVRGSVRARFAAFLFRPRGWLMLSEVRLLSGGRNVARGMRYSLRPAPTPDKTPSYADDGFRLTDGFVARRFRRDALTGWADGDARVFTLNFPTGALVHRLVVWSLAGGKWGIHAPRSVTVETSPDGNRWHSLGTAKPPADLLETGDLQPLTLQVEAPKPALTHWLRVTVRHARGWTMLSEIVVE